MGLLKLALLGIFIGIGLYFLRGYTKGTRCEKNDRIDDKIVLITGANVGIGYETAKELAKRGGIIHMACRNRQRCEKARTKLLEEVKVDGNKVIMEDLDLSSIKSILKFTKEFKEREKKLDILINNAGIMMCPYQETEDGFEMQIGVNHLGHFLLTRELLSLLRASGEASGARIINVSSEGHKFGSMNTTDINLRGEDYGKIAAYGQSKLANILHARELAKRLKSDGIVAVSLHPGSVNTELKRHLPNFLQGLSNILEFVIVRTPFEGAQTQICAAVDPDLMHINGQYMKDCAPKIPGNSEASDAQLAEWLWEYSDLIINEKIAALK